MHVPLSGPVPLLVPVVLSHAPLSGTAVYAALMEIPGVQPWHRRGTQTHAPATAAFAAAQVLQSYGVPFTVVSGPALTPAPPVPTPEMEAAMLAGGLYPWVLDAFAFPYQKRAAAHALHWWRSHIVGEPGSGKTAMSIMYACGTGRRCVMVTLSAAVPQQAAEWRRLTSRPVMEFRAASSRRKSDPDLAEFWRAHANAVVVVGWGLIVDERAALESVCGLGAFGADADRPVVIFDEVQRAKGRKRKTWSLDERGQLQSKEVVNTSSVAAGFARRASGVLTLTGTPVDNVIADLWGQATLVEPDGWGETASRFLMRYCGARPNEYGGLTVDGMDRPNLAELKGRLSFTTCQIPYQESHAHLPPKRRMLVRVRPEDQQKELGGWARLIAAADKDAAKSAAKRERALMVRLELAASRKRGAVAATLGQYVDTGKGKIIVFTGTRKDAEDLAARFTKDLPGVQVWASHGDDSQAAREALRGDYMAHPGPCVLCVTWHAWGTALNLDDTDVIGFAMLPYTPAAIAQAEGRGDRVSMKRPLLFVYFVAEGTVDDRVVHLVIDKMRQVDAVAGGGRLGESGGVGDGLSRTLKGLDDVNALIDELLGRATVDRFAGDEDDAGDFA